MILFILIVSLFKSQTDNQNFIVFRILHIVKIRLSRHK